jgi:uncharacterized protein YggE
MKKKWLVVVSLALVIAVAGLVGCGPQGNVSLGEAASGLKLNLNNQQEGIWVNGSGKVSAVPDIAILRLGIESQQASVAQAQEQANQAMNAVVAALENNGIAEKDIQTQYFNIQRLTRWNENEGREVVIGYRVTNMVTAKSREMENVGAIIDAVAVAGGDLTRIDGISFTVEDPKPYLDQARAEAMADAASKAEQLAEMAGVELGKATYIVENTAYPSPVRQDFAEGVAAAPAMQTPISPGEMEVSVNVQIAYAIPN